MLDRGLRLPLNYDIRCAGNSKASTLYLYYNDSIDGGVSEKGGMVAQLYRYKCDNFSCHIWYLSYNQEKLPEKCDCGHALKKVPVGEPVAPHKLDLDKEEVERAIREQGYCKAKGGTRCSSEK